MTQEEFLNRYHYNPDTDRIGRGGFGSVYKAYDTVRNRYVAIKESQVDKHKFTLQREVELSHEIAAHPNVAKFENCYRFTVMRITVDYAVMEYYPDGSLSDVIGSHSLSEVEKRELITGILQGVAHLHNQGIIHRDLKSGNILVKHENGHWIPKITDFGLSRLSETDSSISNSSIGISYSFAAPEQIKGSATVRKNLDLWSVGTIIYHILTGKLPFNAEGFSDTNSANLEICRKIVNKIIPDDFQYLPQIYKTMIDRCWVVDINKRVQKVEEILEIMKKDMTYNEFRVRYQYNTDTDCIATGIYKAYDTNNKQFVVIKERYLGLYHTDLQQVVEIAQRIGTHANLTKYEVCFRFIHSGLKTDYAVMEYYPDGNLEQFLKKHTLTFEQKCNILMQILEGIDFLHKNNIIHKDLNPRNILIERKGNEFIPKITNYVNDWYLVNADPEAYAQPMDVWMYNSPEQLTGKKINKNTDLWSFGIIAFQVLTGQYPFTIVDKRETIWSVEMELRGQIISGHISKEINTISNDWNRLIKNCLIVDPSQRIANAREAICIVDGREAIPSFMEEETVMDLLDIYHGLSPINKNIPPSKEVIVVPSYFNLLQRQAVIDKNPDCLRLIGKSLAVTMGYYFQRYKNLKLTVAALILEDGTMDISIIKIEDEIWEVKSTNGNAYIGKNIDRIIELCKKTMQDAGISTLDIDELIMVGNTAYTPDIQYSIEKFFGRSASKIAHPEELAIKGAALQYGILTGRTKELAILDVIPISIGIETKEGGMKKVIASNSTIPCKNIETFTTKENNQTSLEIHVLQGEQAKAKDNVTIGHYHLEGIPPMQKGIPQIEVTFDIDANGNFDIYAKEKNTNIKLKVGVN